ncbi:MTH1187 family thiamine-binding protein [Calorimonas adulescens]|uniref:MTH1187 family thiamine-binding protein n=1 Tax=Calorimonas adulescens TaxID=2606906 RepID=A0A5D8QC65_9THEO|nr:MTH1187 family thiamine-binding protein [Calorimonas adulescens]TZE81133.1 MTH1187 family thiamine-binding protein [Calorimonas adulescens]
MSSVNLSLQVIPLVEEEKVYSVVDRVIEYIKATGVKHLVGPMETTMEGDLDTLLGIVSKVHEICEKEGVHRVISVVKIDYSPDGVTMDEKIGKYKEEWR